MLHEFYALALNWAVLNQNPENRVPQRTPATQFVAPKPYFSRKEEELSIEDPEFLNSYSDTSPDRNKNHRIAWKITSHCSRRESPKYNPRGYSRMPDFTSAFMRGVV